MYQGELQDYPPTTWLAITAKSEAIQPTDCRLKLLGLAEDFECNLILPTEGMCISIFLVT